MAGLPSIRIADAEHIEPAAQRVHPNYGVTVASDVAERIFTIYGLEGYGSGASARWALARSASDPRVS